jgi:hypothetical protein
MTLSRRIVALESKADAGADEAAVEWGPGFGRLPPMTNHELKTMLQCMHESGAGRLPIRESNNTTAGAQLHGAFLSKAS